MRQIFSDLWQTETEHPIASAPQVATHAYLYRREEGNVLLYSSSHAEEHRRIADLGGITHQYLSHSDEAGAALAAIRERFGSKLACHRLEVPLIGKHAPVDIAFEGRSLHLDTIEVIPTPGHTPGSTCFLVHSPHGRYLFTGDTVFLSRGTWETLLFREEDREDLVRSVELLRELEPDVVFSSASIGTPAFREMGPGEWRRAMEDVLGSLAPERRSGQERRA